MHCGPLWAEHPACMPTLRYVACHSSTPTFRCPTRPTLAPTLQLRAAPRAGGGDAVLRGRHPGNAGERGAVVLTATHQPLFDFRYNLLQGEATNDQDGTLL